MDVNAGSFLFLLLSIAFTIIKAKDGCKVFDYLPCIKNKTLMGHVIKSFRVTGLQMCQTKCFKEASWGQCVSYNLGPIESNTRMCELSSSDHWAIPKFLVSKEGFEYCPVMNPCSSSPCPQGKLCIPDFSWDTFHCKDGWWATWGPWSGCVLPKTCPPTRKRNCSNPLKPNNYQATCDSGIDVETRNCKIPLHDTAGCENPLGMEDRRITDAQITSSSRWGIYWQPKEGRLNNAPRVWLAGRGTRKGEYIQIDLLRPTFVTMVATQGRPSTNQFIKKYKLSYRNDNQSWNEYEGDCVKIFTGNTDVTSIVTNKLEVPIKARYLRLTVQEYSGFTALRMEVYGCVKENLPLQ